MKIKTGTSVIAKHGIRLHMAFIPKGTVGHVCRISTRLKHVSGIQEEECLVVKFPHRKAFVCMANEVKVLT